VANGIGAKKLFDIEDALSWAVIELLRREREADGRITTAEMMSPMFRLLLVGRGGRGGGFVPMGGPPHPDVLTIEAAILGLRRFADLEISGSCGLLGDMGLEADELGAVRHALNTIVELVITHAKIRRRPPAGIDQPEPKPLYAPNGRPSVMMKAVIEDLGGMPYETEVSTQATRAGSYREGSFCPLVYEPDPQSIVAERAEYAVWHAALRILAEGLSGRLETIAVLPPSAPERPWLGERDSGKPAILQDLSAVFTRHEAERAAIERRQGKRRARPATGTARRGPETQRSAATG
jgi:hypothetical protein